MFSGKLITQLSEHVK